MNEQTDQPVVLAVYRRNRRMYRYDTHQTTNAQELLPLLRQGARLEARDRRKNGNIVTRAALLAILFKTEYGGEELITQAELEQILSRQPINGEKRP